MEDRLWSAVVRLREFFSLRCRLVLAGCLVAGVLLLFLMASNQGRPPVRPVAHPFAPNHESMVPDGVHPMGVDGLAANIPAPLKTSPDYYRQGPVDAAGVLREPRIAYSAELSVVAREFAHARSSLEEILERHRGYVAKLRMVGEPSGSVLSATLRVPSSEYRSALTEFKSVGLVEHEEEAADEITQQHSELDARLVNAQNEEQRILQLLQNRSDKDRYNDPGSLQRQVALLRGEIERMQTERYSSASHVTFANVSFSLREERTPVAETIGAKLRAAAVGGLSDASESISAILLFLAGRGPLLALWAALLYLPARFFWRRYQRTHSVASSAQA